MEEKKLEKKEPVQDDKIQKLRSDLYAKQFEDRAVMTGILSEQTYDVGKEWDIPAMQSKIGKTRKNKYGIIKTLLGISFLFFLCAIAFMFYSFYSGRNTVSVDEVDISIEGPISIKGGDDFTITVKITNNNDSDIDGADLFVTFPAGAYISRDSSDELSETKEHFEKVGRHETVEKTITGIIFGEENSKVAITTSLEFRFEGSNAIQNIEKPYEINIISSPLNVTLGLIKEISQKEEFEINVDVNSNSSEDIKNLFVTIGYPLGFQFKSAIPAPRNSDNNVWRIGDLSVAGKRNIKIKGYLTGYEGEKKEFNVRVGVGDKTEQEKIGVVYNFISGNVIVSQPFIGLDVKLGATNAQGEYVAAGNTTNVSGVITWKSNVPTTILDVQIEAKISGDTLNRFSGSPGNGGYFESINDTIIWNKIGTRSLAVVEPGSSGLLPFSFGSKPLLGKDGSVFVNPVITVEVKAKGLRVSDISVPEEINSTVVQKVKFGSAVNLVARAVHYVGPFANTGPMPPKAEQRTTYTIIWTVTNVSNNVSSAVVRASLPIYVDWVGLTSPYNEDITYDGSTKEVVWNVGKIKAGTGFAAQPREVAFQVSLLPSIKHIGDAPQLISETVLSGEDDFTKGLLTDEEGEITTETKTDPRYRPDESDVVN